MQSGQIHRQKGRRVATTIERLIPCDPARFATRAIPCIIIFLWYTMLHYALIPLVGEETASATLIRWFAHLLLVMVLATFFQALRIDPGLVPKEWAKWVGTAIIFHIYIISYPSSQPLVD
jgi:hypothetical protein